MHVDEPADGGLRRLEIAISKSLAIYAAAAVSGCAGLSGRDEFRLTADQVHSAWLRGIQPDEREAEEQGTYPPGLAGPFFSPAACRWIEPERTAVCRYRVSRGPARPGRNRRWQRESAELSLSGSGWSFAD